jgi:hypothetical protein
MLSYTEIDISFIYNKLAFENEEKCVAFLHEQNLNINNNKLLCKDNLNIIKDSKIIVALKD